MSIEPLMSSFVLDGANVSKSSLRTWGAQVESAISAVVGNNLLVNGDFQINQRAFAGGALSAGAYGRDRWKAGASGANYSVSGFTVTLASGSIQQVISPTAWGFANLASTLLVFSVDGLSADMTVSIGSSMGILTAGSGRKSISLTTTSGDTGNITVELSSFGGGSLTFGRARIGTSAAETNWTARPLSLEKSLCQHYFYSIDFAAGAWLSATVAGFLVQWPTPMRSSPTLTLNTTTAEVVEIGAGPRTASGGALVSPATTPVGGRFELNGFSGAAAQNLASITTVGYVYASSEL